MAPEANSTTAALAPSRYLVPNAWRLLLATALGVGGVIFAIEATPHSAGAAVLAAHAAGVGLPVTFGLLRLARRPEDRFAWLLLATGALYAFTTLAESGDSTFYSAGRVAVWVVEPILVYLVLAFPSGRIDSSGGRRLAVAVALLAATLFVPTALLAPYPEPSPWASCGTHCPANAFQVGDGAPGLVDGLIRPAREVLSVLLFGAVAVAVAQRARMSTPITRRVLTPVVLVAAARAVGLAVYFTARAADTASDVASALGWVYLLSLPALTLAFTGGMLARRLFRADALAVLARGLAPHASPSKLRATLAAALDDPELQVHYWVPGRPGGWVDESGWPVRQPTPGQGRAVTSTSSPERRAVVIHDAALLGDPELTRAIASYVATALENEWLTQELHKSLAELSEARSRVLTAGDEERRRIERDLHDGAQQHLIALGIKLDLLAELVEGESPRIADRIRTLEEEVEATLDEVRHFARGVYPSLLEDNGLADALRASARTSVLPTTVDVELTQRYPRDVERAVYFSCLEAMQNASKHAHGATRVRVTLSEAGRLRFDVRDDGEGFDVEQTAFGAGLTNVMDRLDAVGGRLEVASTPRRGTRVTGLIPLR